VDYVTWYEAEEFCERLSKKEQKKYRLPTEAEWEYACRAGTTTPFSFGSACDGRQANCDGRSPYGTSKQGPHLDRTTVVGAYPPNPFGLYDMHGNFYQWRSDWFASGYYERSPVDDPQGVKPWDLNQDSPRVKAGTIPRVARGGACYVEAHRCRSAARGNFEPYRRAAGFRVVCEQE
jgi:formylglycine-generating enzyme required for sulfatase activity